MDHPIALTMDESYRSLHRTLAQFIPSPRIIDDDLRRLAYGTDASFYRLIPRLVVKVENEEEVIRLLGTAAAEGTPVTFRAAGTSLSGQAISDSVLVVVSDRWKQRTVLDGGKRIRLAPAVIGADANLALLPYGRKIGPDPASINSAMIGGIAANNASGMCCGTAQNSYRTLDSLRMILADGTLLDTADPDSQSAFLSSHAGMAARLGSLAARVRGDAPLSQRIKQKYCMKNTMGYSLNALVDFDDPIQIMQHLLIGSEGTLAFIAEVTLRTVPEDPHKASSLMLFPDIATACSAVPILRECGADAVELMDRASLRSVEEKPGMPRSLAALDRECASLLVELRSPSPEALAERVTVVTRALAGLRTVTPISFSTSPPECATLWNIRKGLFPSVGAMRPPGTTVIIEDVAFPIPRLAEATQDLRALFRQHGYDHAIIFGHALEGNLHFVFHQDFNTRAEVERYGRFITGLSELVLTKYDGALKAEHGTGRNMAPFVEREWGRQAYALMKEIKSAFDPRGLLNPGVILNEDPVIHLRNLKPLPAADPIVDTCIECGFCEVHCPSRSLSLTPRQRIVGYRELARLRTNGDAPDRLARLEASYKYQGDATCATDGLCATSCPVGIDTGKLIKQLRGAQATPLAKATASFISRHMQGVTFLLRQVLAGADAAHGLLGSTQMSALTSVLRRVSRNRIPQWFPEMPASAGPLPRPDTEDPSRPTVVYFPACITRTMGASRLDLDRSPLTVRTLSLLRKAGYRVVFPRRVEGLCCGMAFASKGFTEAGDRKARELEEALVDASGGTLPILVDTSPCLLRMKERFSVPLHLFEPVEFAARFLADRLVFRKLSETVMVHTTCSSRKMGLQEQLVALASRCAETVVVPEGIECCGWAGDRGFTYPELNASALSDLRGSVPEGCHRGISTGRTCEIGLSAHSGVSYQSILSLVDLATEPPAPG